MNLQLIFLALATAVLMSIGQLLFKLGANQIQVNTIPAYLLEVLTSPVLLLACCVYALTILIWIWVLKYLPLSRAYPFTALAYILTPMFGKLFFDERISLQFYAGSFFLLLGILLCTTAVAYNADY